MSEPIWCEIRQQYCRCHDFGKRCEDDVRDQVEADAALKFLTEWRPDDIQDGQ